MRYRLRAGVTSKTKALTWIVWSDYMSRETVQDDGFRLRTPHFDDEPRVDLMKFLDMPLGYRLIRAYAMRAHDRDEP